MKGKNSGATLIENPVTQIEDFVTVHGAFSAGILNTTFLEESRSRASSYKGAGAIREDISAAEFIQKILRNFLGRFRIGKDRQIELKIELGFGAAKIPEAMAAHLPPSRLGAEVRAERRRDEVMNRPASDYRFNYADSAFTGHDDGTTKRNLFSEALHGVRTPREGRYRMDWIRDLATLRTVQEIFVSLFKDGSRVIEYTDSTLRGYLPLEVEDFVGFSSDFLKDDKAALLKNQIIKVIGKTVDLQGQRIALRLLDTGVFLTAAGKLADGSVIADGSEMAGGAKDTTRYA